jgi:two-component system, NtrC family, sensor histidine kinase HydH
MKHGLLVRMTAPLVAVSILLLLVGTTTAWYVHRLQKNSADIVAVNVASIRAAEELGIGVREIRTQINKFLLTGDPQHLAAVPAQRQATEFWLNRAVQLATTQRERELMSAVQQGYQRFFAEFDQLAAAEVLANSSTELRELVDTGLTNDILKPAHQYLDLNERIIEDSSRAGQALARRMVLGLLVLGTCGPMAGLLVGFVVARRISQTLVELSVPVRDAAGRLSEVVGPITLAGQEMEELPVLAQGLATQVAAVVERLQQSQQEVLRSEQLAAVGQLAAGVAHELRNPLQSMQLLIQSAVAEGDAGCLQGRDLAVLQEAVDRVKRSVQAFLDFARPPALEKHLLDLGQISRQTADLVAARARRQGVRLHCEIPAVPVLVEADPDQMRQLVLNLLLNALDALPERGDVSIRLRDLRRDGETAASGADSEAPAAWVCLEVADDGCGLPAELGKRIFEPFVTTKDTGIGLGLAICRRIIEAHGGELQAADRSPRGAVFTVRLPAAERPVVASTGRDFQPAPAGRSPELPKSSAVRTPSAVED